MPFQQLDEPLADRAGAAKDAHTESGLARITTSARNFVHASWLDAAGRGA